MTTVRSNSLSNTQNANTTVWTESQNRAVLIAGLTCACFSLLTTLITLRWFILMKRTFRHQLIMLLICSDTFKAFWYFVFPIVVFSRGPVSSDSKFCQVSGFFLAFGIEASDCAILLIALHSILYIFTPSTRSSEGGGLYRWRKWIYPIWIAFPLVFASLAFVNEGDAYTTAGTYCYLPRRPYWYRLALSWIPRYLILSLIFYMYAAVYLYVTIKFRSFSHLDDSDRNLSSDSHGLSHRSISFTDHEMDIAPDEIVPPKGPEKKVVSSRPGWSRQSSYKNDTPARPSDPWDEVSFITAKPLRNSTLWQPGVQTSDFANLSGDQTDAADPKRPNFRMDTFAAQSRKPSACPTTASSFTGETLAGSPAGENSKRTTHHSPKLSSPTRPKEIDPLKRTRTAIRRQLRYLFIYPAVYILMWVFPFVSHCLLYEEYYILHPIYWLSILQTSMLALQAAADCIVFSWREKPWRRIPADSQFALTNIRNSVSFRKDPTKTQSNKSFVCTASDEEAAVNEQGHVGMRSGNSSRITSTHWWEAEGRKRKDSVWMSSDLGDAAAAHSPARRDNFGEPLTTIMSEDDRESANERQPTPQYQQHKRDESSLDTLVGGLTDQTYVDKLRPNDHG